MPLVLYEETMPATRLGVWKIEEEEAFFRAALALSPSETAELAVVKGPKRLEFLADACVHAGHAVPSGSMALRCTLACRAAMLPRVLG